MTGLSPAPDLYPSPDLYPGEGGAPSVSHPLASTTVSAIHVREVPPLRMSIEIETPNGRFYRWAEDELNPANVPSGLRHSATMPGGYESLDVTLPRRTGVDYQDLESLSTIRCHGSGGEIFGEYRLERQPSVSGDQMTISPSAVGWQAALDDNKAASVIFIDRELAHWGAIPRPREATLLAPGNNWGPSGAQQQPDDATGYAVLATEIRGSWTATSRPIVEAWYDAGSGNRLGLIKGDWAIAGTTIDPVNTNWLWLAGASSDNNATAVVTTANLRAAGPGSFSLTVPSYRYGFLEMYFAAGPSVSDNTVYAIHWNNLRAIGDHGLTPEGSGDAEGFRASDMAAWVVGAFAPELSYTKGTTVLATDFLIPHASYPEPTTGGAIIRDIVRYGLEDWAVWEGPTFWMHPRGAFSRTWRARIAPTQLEQTGQQVDRIWNSVVVQYKDVSGETRTAGPPGSGADVEHDSLVDSDPQNPATVKNITRRALLSMGIGTPESAIVAGGGFLQESKLLDTSGRARLVGHVIDDAGVAWPYHAVRPGDYIVFIDASDTSARRIVRTDCDRASRSCSVDLDSPPEGLQALLERWDVDLIGLI